MKVSKVSRKFVVTGMTLAAALAAAPALRGDTPWSFGVMSDTQWTVTGTGIDANPNTYPTYLVNQLNQQFHFNATLK